MTTDNLSPRPNSAKPERTDDTFGRFVFGLMLQHNGYVHTRPLRSSVRDAEEQSS
jgi:hypothetical protein